MPREYSQAGVDYTKIEPFKQAMQVTGKRTLQILNRAHNGPFCTMREWLTRVVLALDES